MKRPLKRQWLITAFDAFAGRSQNNSILTLNEIKRLVSNYENASDWPFQFHYFILPTEFDRCFTLLQAEIKKLEAQGIDLEGILSMGEGFSDFKIETQANNRDDVDNYPDNKGVVRTNHRTLHDYAGDTIPFRFPVQAFTKIRTSTSPGFFVCNNLCAWMAREHAPAEKPSFGFIHVPREGQGGIFTATLCAELILLGFTKLK